MTIQMLIALFTRKATLMQILGDFEKVKTNCGSSLSRRNSRRPALRLS